MSTIISRRFAEWLRLSKNKELMQTLRKHSPSLDQYRVAIKAGCERFGLNSNDPLDCHLLFVILADLHFRSRIRPALGSVPLGRRKGNTRLSPENAKLVARIREFSNQKTTMILRRLRKRYAPDYRHLSDEAFRKRIERLRKMDMN